jgi:hypothetical protein
MEENNTTTETTITATTIEVAPEAQVEAQAPTEVAELPAELAGAQPEQPQSVAVEAEVTEASKYKLVAHADVPALIAAGENPLMLRSPEAPHGYKLDGTPAAQRGRKVGSGQGPKKKVLANPKHGNVGKRFRAQEGAPFGVKSDGTPAKKRGRPSKNPGAVSAPSAVPVTKVVVSETSVAEAQAIVEAVNAAPVAEEVAATVVEKAEKAPINKGTKVRMVEAACKNEKQAKLTGEVTRVSSLFAFVRWNNGQQQWRALDTIQAI